MEFWSEKSKAAFMKQVKLNQKDAKGQHIPVLAEKVFKLSDNHASRAKEIHFRNGMTEYTRKIFNEARKHKDVFLFTWINQKGVVMVRESETSNSIALYSFEQLSQLLNSFIN